MTKQNSKSIGTQAWHLSQFALFFGAVVGSTINLRVMGAGGAILLAAATVSVAQAGQPSSLISFSTHPSASALSTSALGLCEGQANKFGDGTGSGDVIDPTCLQAFYLKANPVAVRSDLDDSDFAFGFGNLLMMRGPRVTLVATATPGVRQRQVNASQLADVIVTGHSSQLHDIQALAIDQANEEVHVLDTSGSVLSFAFGLGGNLAPARVFTLSNPSDVSSIAIDPSSDQLILVRTGEAKLDFYSRRADVNGHQSYSATGALRSLGGAQTGLVGPVDAVVASPAGELIVLDRAGNQILIYSSSAAGDVAPKRTIRGALTGISNPMAISYSASADQIVVWNGNGSSLVFPRTASGDAAPLAPGP